MLASECHESKASSDDCAKMRAHYIDVGMAEDPSLTSLSKDQRAAVRDMKEAIARGDKDYKKAGDGCMKNVSEKQSECALVAKTVDAWTACLK